MKFVKRGILAVIITIFIITLAACSASQELKLGDYVSASDSFISVKLQSDNEFQLNGPDVVSMVVTGTYSVQDGVLTLTSSDSEVHEFSMKDDALIFESGTWLENWVEQGTEFHLSNG